MDDNTIFEAFDLTQYAEAPDSETEATGENWQEVADPAAQEAEKTEKTAQPKPEQTPEERSRQAHGRRQRELDDARSAGRSAAVEEMDELLGRLGLSDPQSGEPVNTVEKLKEYERSLSAKRIAAGKGTEADIRRIIREEAQKQTEKSAPQPDPKEVETIVAQQLSEIRKLDPGVKSMNDILSADEADSFRAYVGKGLSFVEAYRLAFAAKIDAGRRSADAQKQRQESKSHLGATVTHGQGGVAVPTEEAELFRALMPDATDAEIEKRWNADRKRFRR